MHVLPRDDSGATYDSFGYYRKTYKRVINTERLESRERTIATEELIEKRMRDGCMQTVFSRWRWDDRTPKKSGDRGRTRPTSGEQTGIVADGNEVTTLWKEENQTKRALQASSLRSKNRCVWVINAVKLVKRIGTETRNQATCFECRESRKSLWKERRRTFLQTDHTATSP